MPEGLKTAAGVTGGVHDDADHKPEPSAEAPRGWTWDRKNRKWSPRQRGDILFQAGDGKRDGRPDPDRAGSDGAGQGAADGPERDRDPDPSWLRADSGAKDGKPGKKKHRIEDVPKATVDDIAGFAGLVGTPILAMLQQADPYCGSILAQSFEGIVDATLPLICRSEKIVRYFSGDDTDWLLWGKLALALKPFAQAVIEHHIVGSVRVDRDEHGQVVILRRSRDAEPDHGDHLTPPAQQYAA